ncbi:hypothetical protein AAOE16_15595 [Ekhidna sp. MALMAid0563]|uniref:hypothetical protein n=1 Tax=Ekhidna sp. MALMAid0563 TaxID=3143937 RepID=UPI0032DE4B0F
MKIRHRTLLSFYLSRFFLLSFLLIAGSLQAQRSKIDSLEAEMSLHIEKDTIRVNLLNELAFSYFSKDLTTSIEYLDEADEIANAIHFEKGKARSIYIRGITENRQYYRHREHAWHSQRICGRSVQQFHRRRL